MIYRLLYKMLHDAPDVRNLVGVRIYGGHAPDETQGPCIVLRKLSSTINSHLRNEASIAQPTVQIDYYDSSMSKAEAGGEIIRLLLSGYQRAVFSVIGPTGALIDVTVDSVQLRRAGEVIDEPRDASDRWSYRHSADYEVFHSQAVPTHV
jgi:hypothetical protein